MELADLRRMAGGFQASSVIFSANNVRVFDRLLSARTAAQCARLIKCDARATEILLDALTAVGLVKKSGARYRNTPIADKYLVSGKPLYQGDILRHNSYVLKRWGHLDDVLRTGRPAARQPDGFESFIMGMHNLSVLRSPELLRAMGLKGVKAMLDLGGGPGTHAINMSKKGISATIFDMPATIKIARKVVKREGGRNIKYIAGDFHLDDIGSGYDLILMSQIAHSNSLEENARLVKKCAAALNPGGRIAVHEFPLDETRTAPPQGALFSINMLVATEGGRCYTPSEIKGWLREAGLRTIKQTTLKETMLITGEKRAIKK